MPTFSNVAELVTRGRWKRGRGGSSSGIAVSRNNRMAVVLTTESLTDEEA